MFLAQLAELIV